MAMFCRRASTVRSGVKRVQEYKSGRVQGEEAAGENYWDGWILTQRSPRPGRDRRQREDSQDLGPTRCCRSPQESVREIFDRGCCAQ